MEIGINTICMAELPWRRCLAEAAAAGFENVELLAIENSIHVQPGQVDPAEVLAEAERAGVRVSGLHAGGMGAATDEQLRTSIAYIRKAAELARALGVDYLVFTGFPSPEGQDAAARAETCERFGRGLAELMPLMADCGLPIALENHYRCQVETPEDYRAIFAVPGTDSPQLGVTVDTGHFTASGVDPAAVAREFAPRVRNVHVKDHVGPRSVALGHGRTDNAAVVRALRAGGYDGPLTVEIEAEDRHNALRYVREAMPYMRRLQQV